MPNPAPVTLSPATLDEIEPVLAMVRGLSRWLATRGIRQWSDSFPTSVLEAEVARRELFVLRQEGEIAASVALSKEAGDFWEASEGNALYLHRLTVARNRGGEKLGEAVVAWAENHARKTGADRLRLVCDAGNPFLPGYYARLGFQAEGSIYFEPWKMTFAKFGKALV